MNSSASTVALLFFGTLLSLSGINATPSTFQKSSFVPPAAPTIVSHNVKNTPNSQILANRLIAGYGVFTSLQQQQSAHFKSTMLFAKPNRKGAKSSKGGKVQVKLLKNIPGTGVIGDVIMVTPAFFENKLKKTQSAVRISDEEVSKEKETSAKKQKAELETANDMKDHLTDYELVLKRKAGPEGHLFGGVGKKVILEELRSGFPKGALDGKSVKISKIRDAESGEEVKQDIKEIGVFTATISLLSDIKADFSVTVEAE